MAKHLDHECLTIQNNKEEEDWWKLKVDVTDTNTIQQQQQQQQNKNQSRSINCD